MLQDLASCFYGKIRVWRGVRGENNTKRVFLGLFGARNCVTSGTKGATKSKFLKILVLCFCRRAGNFGALHPKSGSSRQDLAKEFLAAELKQPTKCFEICQKDHLIFSSNLAKPKAYCGLAFARIFAGFLAVPTRIGGLWGIEIVDNTGLLYLKRRNNNAFARD